MNPTLQFFPTPTPAPRISPRLRNRRARLTPDTRIPPIIKLQPENPLYFRILSNPIPIPVRQHTHFLHLLPRRSPMILHLLQPRPRRRLLPPQPRKPPIKRLQRPHQRLHLPHPAALRRLHNMQLPKLPLKLRHGSRRHCIHKVYPPLLHHPIPISNQLLEVIPGLQKNHRNIPQKSPKHM